MKPPKSGAHTVSVSSISCCCCDAYIHCLCHSTICSMSFNVNHSQAFPEGRIEQGKNEKKDTYVANTNSLPYLLQPYYQSTSLAVLVPPFLLITYPITIPSKFLPRVHTPSPRPLMTLLRRLPAVREWDVSVRALHGGLRRCVHALYGSVPGGGSVRHVPLHRGDRSELPP